MAVVLRRSPVYLAVLGLILGATLVVPAAAQQSATPAFFVETPKLSATWPAFDSGTAAASQFNLDTPVFLHGLSFTRPADASIFFTKPIQTNNPTTIDRMEAAFYCNDTPFVDQVRFPLASLWRGRLKLVGFESDVTTANFVLGLPGGGTLRSMGMFSSGHLVMHTPPSDQLTGVHLTLNLRGSEVNNLDNSGLHGLQYVMRASRDFFQSVTGR